MGSFTFFLPCNALKTQTDKHGVISAIVENEEPKGFA